MNNLTRRDFLKWTGVGIAATAAAAALASCGSNDDKTSDNTNTNTSTDNTGTTTSSGGVNNQDTTVVTGDVDNSETEETGILPHMSVSTGIASLASMTPFRSVSGQFGYNVRWLYDRLLYVSPSGERIKQCLKDYSVQEDGKTWDMEIWDFIYDSEGNHITAEDIVWFIETYMATPQKPCFGNIESVKTTGDYTLQMVMKMDMVDIPEIIMISTWVCSQKAFEASSDGFASSVVSTSPYKVTEFTGQASATLERRDDYWAFGTEAENENFNATIQTIDCVNITESSQMVIALETGTVDAIPGITAAVAQQFVDDSDNYFTCTAPSNEQFFLCFSGSENRPVIANDVWLRRAICHAIDVQGIIDGVQYGFAEEPHDFLGRTCPNYDPSWNDRDYFPYDLDYAKECLEKSNYKGEPLEYMVSATNKTLGEVIQGYCAAIGVNIQLKALDAALWATSWYDGDNYDMFVICSGNGIANVWSQFLDGEAYPKGDCMARKDEVLTEMIHEAWKNANYTQENITEIQDYVWDNAYIRGLYLNHAVTVINKNVKVVKTVFNCMGPLDLANTLYAV